MPDFIELPTVIKLKRKVTYAATPDQVTNIGAPVGSNILEITAEDSEGDPVDIFVYHREVFDARAEEPTPDTSFFSHIASPADYMETPTGIPTDETTLYFRYNKIMHVTNSDLEVEYIWDEVVKDVQYFIRTAKRLNDPVPSQIKEDEVVIGD